MLQNKKTSEHLFSLTEPIDDVENCKIEPADRGKPVGRQAGAPHNGTTWPLGSICRGQILFWNSFKELYTRNNWGETVQENKIEYTSAMEFFHILSWIRSMRLFIYE